MKKHIILLILPLLVMGCSTSNHGSFIASSHIDNQTSKHQSLGSVTGESRQTWVLYLFPRGDAPSTNAAIQDAKSKVSDTKYLTDISIDDHTFWSIGFYQQIIKVEAEAHK
jgi:hypothetical protein